MTTYTAALEALDVKRGRVHTVADWKFVGEKAAQTPELLTEDDLIVLEGFGGAASVAAALERRDRALAVPAPPDPPAATKRAPAADPAPALPSAATVPDRADSTKAFLVRHGKKAVSYNFLFNHLIPILAEMKVHSTTRVEALEQEIAALKARPLQKWAGTHVTGRPYAEASLVTRGGSLWVATTATTSTPGEHGGDWRLIVKKGSA